MSTANTAASMAPAIGSTVLLPVESHKLRVPATILDVKEAWGSLRYLVAPVNGSGSMWVLAERVRRVEP